MNEEEQLASEAESLPYVASPEEIQNRNKARIEHSLALNMLSHLLALQNVVSESTSTQD